MKRATDAARRARATLVAEISGIARYATGPAFSQASPADLRSISLALLVASDLIEQEIERRLDAGQTAAESRRP